MTVECADNFDLVVLLHWDESGDGNRLERDGVGMETYLMEWCRWR